MSNREVCHVGTLHFNYRALVAYSAQESAKALKSQLDQQKGVVEKLISNTRV